MLLLVLGHSMGAGLHLIVSTILGVTLSCDVNTNYYSVWVKKGCPTSRHLGQPLPFVCLGWLRPSTQSTWRPRLGPGRGGRTESMTWSVPSAMARQSTVESTQLLLLLLLHYLHWASPRVCPSQVTKQHRWEWYSFEKKLSWERYSFESRNTSWEAAISCVEGDSVMN
jgi:hypothetical protein